MENKPAATTNLNKIYIFFTSQIITSVGVYMPSSPMIRPAGHYYSLALLVELEHPPRMLQICESFGIFVGQVADRLPVL